MEIVKKERKEKEVLMLNPDVIRKEREKAMTRLVGSQEPEEGSAIASLSYHSVTFEKLIRRINEQSKHALTKRAYMEKVKKARKKYDAFLPAEKLTLKALREKHPEWEIDTIVSVAEEVYKKNFPAIKVERYLQKVSRVRYASSCRKAFSHPDRIVTTTTVGEQGRGIFHEVPSNKGINEVTVGKGV